jgi:hypothetical protein
VGCVLDKAGDGTDYPFVFLLVSLHQLSVLGSSSIGTIKF